MINLYLQFPWCSAHLASSRHDNFALLHVIIIREAQNKIRSAKTSTTIIRIDCDVSERAVTCNKITLRKIISQTRGPFARHRRKQSRRLNQDIHIYSRFDILHTAADKNWILAGAVINVASFWRALYTLSCVIHATTSGVKIRILSDLEAASCTQHRRREEVSHYEEKSRCVINFNLIVKLCYNTTR